jgi:hypothetical protein
MSSRTRPAIIGLLWIALAAALPADAGAQWYFAGYFGTNHTHAAAVELDVPAADLVVTFDDVRFEGRPFAAPQYYGARIGWLAGANRRYGVEVEFIHLKVIADTAREYVTRGRLAGVGDDGRLRMDVIASRYSMTHGLNFLVVNGVVRRPWRPRLAFIARAGVGATLPHSESTVLGQPREQYEYAGLGSHAAAGVDWQLRGPLSLHAEYKLTYARPEIAIAGGVGRTRTLTHHFAFGFGFGLTR